MGDIVDIKPKDIITTDQVLELLGSFTGEGDEGSLEENTVLKFLALDDENFKLLAPPIVEAFAMSVNNPNDSLALTQAVAASGYKAEDMIEAFQAIVGEIDASEFSQPKKDFIKQCGGIVCTAISQSEGVSKRVVQIAIELCNDNAKVPQYANLSDSGMDVYAIEDCTIAPGETVLVPTGIKMALPPGYEIQVRPKSGRAYKTKLRVANTPGTIDAGYRDEIKVIIENIEPRIKDIEYDFDEVTHQPIIKSIEHGASYTIGKGEKFAQLVLMEVPKATLYTIDSVLEIGENRGGGFGSTGLK